MANGNTIEVRFRPSAPQLAFLKARCKHVGYGGARGGGKSYIVRKKAGMLCQRWPGIKVLIVRRTFRELDNNHILPMLEELHGQAKYNRQDKRFTFPNGSTISFGYCDCDGDLGQYQGAEYDIIFLDEATQLKQEWVEKITACCRGTKPFPRRMYYTMNPGGVSHAYFKRLFVDSRFVGSEEPDDYTFIQAKVTDNKALMEAQPDYIKQLENLPPKLRKAWLEGSWDIFEGAFFEEFRNDPSHYEDRQWTHVISAEKFRLPRAWQVYRSFDWGFRRPFSCGYWTIDYDGVIYRIAEFYGCQRDTKTGESIPNEGLRWSPNRVFAALRDFEDIHPLLAGRDIYGVADPAIWDKETGISIAETAEEYGIAFDPADNKRIPGWMQLHYRMQFDNDGYPRMYVLDSCKDFIRTFPTLQFDDHKVEDLDTEGEDHIADECRYFCMQHMIQPMEAKPQPVRLSDPLDMFTDY